MKSKYKLTQIIKRKTGDKHIPPPPFDNKAKTKPAPTHQSKLKRLIEKLFGRLKYKR